MHYSRLAPLKDLASSVVGLSIASWVIYQFSNYLEREDSKHDEEEFDIEAYFDSEDFDIEAYYDDDE